MRRKPTWMRRFDRTRSAAAKAKARARRDGRRWYDKKQLASMYDDLLGRNT